jgi:hypothetical protein
MSYAVRRAMFSETSVSRSPVTLVQISQMTVAGWRGAQVN